MLNKKNYENSLGDGHPVMEIAGVTEGLSFVPLRKTEITGEITGPLASMKLIQTFSFSKEEFPDAIEAVYRFPLPGDCAVLGVRIMFGDCEVVALLKGREEAKQEYEKAKQEGKQAALATKQGPDIFSLNVNGIKPGEPVCVETTFAQVAKPEDDGWTLRVPLTTAPRYCAAILNAIESGVTTPEAEAGIQAQPLAIARDPKHRFSVNLDFINASGIDSRTHLLTSLRNEDATHTAVSLLEHEEIPNKDFVISWKPKRSKHPALKVYTHNESEYTHFMALAIPPAESNAVETKPRETVIIVDQSGSMGGTKIDAAVYAAKHYLSGLTEKDSFCLGWFHDSQIWHNEEPVPATDENIKAAMKFADQPVNMGGTRIDLALHSALAKQKTEGEKARHLLLITDGQMYGAEASDCILKCAEEYGKAGRRRVSVICIDSAPNSYLVDAMSEAGGGETKYLNSLATEGDVATSLENMLEKWGQPVLIDTRISIKDIEGQEIEAASKSLDLGDVPAGRAVWIVGRVRNKAARSDNGKWRSQPLSFELTAGKKMMASCGSAEYSFRPAIKALFGARRLDALEFALTCDQDTRSSMMKGFGYEQFADVKKIIREEALSYGLPSSQTSFIAVRKESKVDVKAQVGVANALPEGWSDGFVGLSGCMGCSGQSGYSGMSGFSSASGTSGFSGVFAGYPSKVQSPVAATDRIGYLDSMSEFANVECGFTSIVLNSSAAGYGNCTFVNHCSDSFDEGQTLYQLGGQTFTQPQFYSPLHTATQCSFFPAVSKVVCPEYTLPGTNNVVPAMLNPGEYVLRTTACSAVSSSKGQDNYLGFRKHLGLFNTVMNAGRDIVGDLMELRDQHISIPFFTGVPRFKRGVATLFNDKCLRYYSKIEVVFDPKKIDIIKKSKAVLAIFVGNEAEPRARIKLKDFVRLSKRPLSFGTGNENLKILLLGDGIEGISLAVQLQ